MRLSCGVVYAFSVKKNLLGEKFFACQINCVMLKLSQKIAVAINYIAVVYLTVQDGLTSLQIIYSDTCYRIDVQYRNMFYTVCGVEG
eukprot:m.69412 g.69412  ORF g.69412 m.69412 type:complete len:87 (+) comp11623_c0_seq6:172-432(+)